MGGINHQPTTNVSLAHTVPAAESLTMAMSELMLGNVQIERLVQLTGTTQFGVGKQRLIGAANHFDSVVTQLGIVQSYVGQNVAMVANPDYEPFDLSQIDVDQLIEGCIRAGLLMDSEPVRTAVEVTKLQGYQGVFFVIGDLCQMATERAERLAQTTKDCVNGPEGTQGYFWANVEANRNTWRQDFMAALTALQRLMSFWATTAAICTEVHLAGTRAPGLLENYVPSI